VSKNTMTLPTDCKSSSAARFAALWWLAIALFSTAVAAQPAVPALTARVTDLAGALAPAQRQALEQQLQAFEAGKGSQVAVLIVPSTQPDTIEQYALRVAEAWKLGRRGVDDGALLLIAKDDRALRIEVGYGLEGALPDAIAKRIISDVIMPSFRKGDFAGGVQHGVDAMLRVIEGEPLPAPSSSAVTPSSTRGENFSGILLMMGIVAAMVLPSALGNLAGDLAAGGIATVLGWMITGSLFAGLVLGFFVFIIIQIGDSRGGPGGRGRWSTRGGYGGDIRRGSGKRGSTWSGSGSRGGGGGFSGGGGGFGGGGASGRW
jgi:uncharacterized protein